MNPLRHKPVEFNDDLSEAVIAGHRFKAVPHEPGKCGDCAFKDGFSCLSFDAGRNSCQPHARPDERDVIWLPA